MRDRSRSRSRSPALSLSLGVHLGAGESAGEDGSFSYEAGYFEYVSWSRVVGDMICMDRNEPFEKKRAWNDVDGSCCLRMDVYTELAQSESPCMGVCSVCHFPCRNHGAPSPLTRRL